MLEQKISRNDQCPCGSGRKYKHCCIGKNIDWSAKKSAPRLPPARVVSKPSRYSFGQFAVVDAKLKAIAREQREPSEWKFLVERLSDATSDEDRMKTYQTVREAKVIPDEAGDFLLAWATQWMQMESLASTESVDDDLDEEIVRKKFDEGMLAQLRRFGATDLADLFLTNLHEYDRRYEQGRQFFHGPPDGELAKTLREKGVIE